MCLGREAAADATLFRMFLKDGGVLVSYGEFTRVEDRVVFSMPVGGERRRAAPAGGVDVRRLGGLAAHRPLRRLGPLPALRRDARARRTSAHPQRRCGARAQRHRRQHRSRRAPWRWPSRARTALADWPLHAPRLPPGRRPRDRRRSSTRRSPACAPAAAPPRSSSRWWRRCPRSTLEPVLGMPTPREQLDPGGAAGRLTHAAHRTLTLLQTALAMLDESGAGLIIPEPPAHARVARGRASAASWTSTGATRELSQQLVTQRRPRGGAGAHLGRGEGAGPHRRARTRKLGPPPSGGGRRAPRLGRTPTSSAPAACVCCATSGCCGRRIYQDYQRLVGSQLLDLVKAQPPLEAIRRLDGPPAVDAAIAAVPAERRRRAAGAPAGARRSARDPRPARRRLALRRERRAPALRRRLHRQRGPRVGGVVGGRRRADAAVAGAAEHSRAAGATPLP